jgi:hypothetical protein
MNRGHIRSWVMPLLVASGGFACSGLEEAPDVEMHTQAAVLISQQTIDTVKDELRQPVVDVVDIGPANYVVGNILPSGDLHYSYYATTTGQQVAPFTEGGAGTWIRGNTSKSVTWPNCDGTGFKTGFVNYFAVVLGGTVFLDEHARCAGAWRPFNFTTIDLGDHPAVATRGSITSGRALVAYGQNDHLMGRFVSFTGFGKVLGTPFSITTIPGGGVFSVDLIYNQHSNRYIAGYIERGPGFCRVKNVTITDASPPVIGTATQFGGCDTDIGGHHTSVAYNPLMTDGSYVWWRQDMQAKKRVFIHDSQGQLTSFTPFLTDDPNPFPGSGATAWTVPVTNTYDSATPYMLFKESLTNIFGLRADKSWSLVEPMNLTTHQMAVRSVGSETVAITKPFNGTTLFLTVSDKP